MIVLLNPKPLASALTVAFIPISRFLFSRSKIQLSFNRSFLCCISSDFNIKLLCDNIYSMNNMITFYIFKYSLYCFSRLKFRLFQWPFLSYFSSSCNARKRYLRFITIRYTCILSFLYLFLLNHCLHICIKIFFSIFGYSRS